MLPHTHISLCDEEWNFYYDYIDFDTVSSVPKFLDLVFNLFNPENIPRDAVEAEIYDRLDRKSSNPIYFQSGNILYLWVYCTKCKAASLN